MWQPSACYIETGRFSTPVTPLSNRLCKFCNLNCIEDEIHFLIECPLYNDIRSNFIEILNEKYVHFKQQPSLVQYCEIMNESDTCIQKTLAKAASCMWIKRKHSDLS